MVEHRTIVVVSIIACSLLVAPGTCAQESEGGDQVSDLPPAAQHDRFQIVAIDRVWTSAERRRDREAERAADARLDQWLETELGEAEREAAAARAEADDQSEEAGESRRPVDRHAARDDERDARLQLGDLDRLIELIRELKTLQPRFVRGDATRAQYSRKRIILRDLVRLARTDVRDSRQETVEDTAESGRTRRRGRR